MRPAALLLFFAAACPAPGFFAAPAAHEYVQAVEFPYYLYPRAQWERELVWMKSIGIRTVEFAIPWNWHETGPDHYDFTGETSPRRDLTGLIRILRRLQLEAWVRTGPPIANWPEPALDGARHRAWQRELAQLLGTQTAGHGGPVRYVEGAVPGVDAVAPPLPVMAISAVAPNALAESRAALGVGRGSLVWRDVEDAIYPAGWAPGVTWLRTGAVGLAGNETATAAVRRDAALLRHWGEIFPSLKAVAMPKTAARLPDHVTAYEMVSPAASAVSVTNRGRETFEDDLRVAEPETKRTITIPKVTVPPGESLWLPVSVSLGPDGLCHECSNFSGVEHIVYATAELLDIEFENGILAMEFAAPEEGEAVLQFARKPVGPYLAAGKPEDFDWDDKTLRARLKIPAGKGRDHHVRVGIAIEEPETSAFFDEARRLVIGQKNALATTYSAPDVARRSRLRLPDGFTASSKEKTPNQIEYDVTVPTEAVHGDWANLALEADGMPLGRARLQMFRPLTVRLTQAIRLHFGTQTELEVQPSVAPVEPKAGTEVELRLRNNSPDIATFRLEAAGDGLDFFPPKTEISVGGMAERPLLVRVFGKEGAGGLRDWHLRVKGAADMDLPMRVVLVPRGQTVAWSADLDGDGSAEWVLESPKARAVFSSQDGGRWMEFTWKDADVNFLPVQGVLAGSGAVTVKAEGNALEFDGKGWKRTVRLTDSTLSIEQSGNLPDLLAPEKRGNVTLTVQRKASGTAEYRLH